MVSRFRPATDIVAITPVPRTYRQLALSWGVTPLMNEYRETSKELFEDAASKVKEADIAKDGDIIIITGSSDRIGEMTNTLQIHVLGNILLRGQGNNLPPATGRLYVASGIDDLYHNFRDGDILVIEKTTPEVLQVIKKAKGIITEEEMDQSGAAAAGIAMGHTRGRLGLEGASARQDRVHGHHRRHQGDCIQRGCVQAVKRNIVSLRLRSFS